MNPSDSQKAPANSGFIKEKPNKYEGVASPLCPPGRLVLTVLLTIDVEVPDPSRSSSNTLQEILV